MTIVGILATALAFAAFTYAGILVATTYFANGPRLDGAPRPQPPPVLVLVVAAAIVGGVCSWRGTPAPTLAILAATLGLLVAIWCVDVLRGIVPDALTLIPLGAFIVAGLMNGHWYVLLAAVVPALPFALMAYRTKGLGIGWGDVKLVALGGALLGMQTAILAFAVAAVAAVLVARLTRRGAEPLAFAPYLVTAIAVPLAVAAW